MKCRGPLLNYLATWLLNTLQNLGHTDTETLLAAFIHGWASLKEAVLHAVSKVSPDGARVDLLRAECQQWVSALAEVAALSERVAANMSRKAEVKHLL